MFYAWQSNDSYLQYVFYPPSAMKQVDLRTGEEKSLRGWEQLGKTPRRYTLSPDCKKALWQDSDGIRSLSLGASSPIYTNPRRMDWWATSSQPVWTPDSKRWIQLFAGSQGLVAVVHAEGKTAPDQEIKIGNPTGTSSDYELLHTHLIGVTQTGSVLATPEAGSGHQSTHTTRHIPFFEFSLDPARPKVREYTIELPRAGARFESEFTLAIDEEIELSPQGDRLAWLVHRQVNSPAPAWLSRWLPRASVVPRFYTELRVTDPDGTNVRTIGSTEWKPLNRDSAAERPCRMHWLPDGRHISFLYDGSLWVAPTQEPE